MQPEQTPQNNETPTVVTPNVITPTQGISSVINQSPITPTPAAPQTPYITGSSLDSQNHKSIFDSTTSDKSGLFSLIGGASSIAIILIIIFAGNILSFSDGQTAFILQLLLVSSLSLAGIVFGYINQQDKNKSNGMGALGLALASVVFVLCLIVGSYYLKLTMALNSYKNDYKSNSSLR